MLKIDNSPPTHSYFQLLRSLFFSRQLSTMATPNVASSLKIFMIFFFLMINSVYAFRIGSSSRLSIKLHAVKSTSSDKIRVKLLADVKGTGRYHQMISDHVNNRVIFEASLCFNMTGKATSYLYRPLCGLM